MLRLGYNPKHSEYIHLCPNVTVIFSSVVELSKHYCLLVRVPIRIDVYV